MTSAPIEMVGQKLLRFWTNSTDRLSELQMKGGQKIPKSLRTSFMDGPFALGEEERRGKNRTHQDARFGRSF